MVFPWVSKSSFLAVALTAFTSFLLAAVYLLYFTSRTELKVHSHPVNAECTRLADVSGSSLNMWPPTHLSFATLDSRTPLPPEEAQNKWLAWWEDSQYRIQLETAWPAELEDGEEWTTCQADCRLTHAVDHSGTELFLKADSNANVRLDHPNLSLQIYNFPGQSEPIISLSFEFIDEILRGTLQWEGSSDPKIFQPARYFSQTILLNLKFYTDSFEVWMSIPTSGPVEGDIGDATQTRAFFLSNYPFSGPYWIVVNDINGGSENEVYWTVQGTAQPPATQDYFWTGSSELVMNSIYFESEAHCESEALSICSSLTNQIDIGLTSGSYDEPTCYSSGGQSSFAFDDSMGSIQYSWTDMVWQGRDLNSGLGWDDIALELHPRAHETAYANLPSLFPSDNWYVCGYKSVPLWIDCLQDIRCVYEDNGQTKRMMFNYQVSSAIVEFGEIPCIERITATQLFVRRTVFDDSEHNCIAPTTLETMDLFLEIPGAMNSWWNCDSYGSVSSCLSEPHRGQDQCIYPINRFPETLEECENSELACSVVTKFDGTMSVSSYEAKYGTNISETITGQALFNFTHLYVSPHDQCQLIDEQLCDDRFTSALCSKFAAAGPYLCNTDEGQDYLGVAFESAGIAALLGWIILFCILLYQSWCCCNKKDVLMEKKKALEKRKRERKRKRRERKRQKAENTEPASAAGESQKPVLVEPLVAKISPAPLVIQRSVGSHDIQVEGRFENPRVVNDPIQMQELEDLANGTLPLLYSDYSAQSYQPNTNTHSPRRPPYSNTEMYNQFSPQRQDLAYEEFGDHAIPRYQYYDDPDSLPSEYRASQDLFGLYPTNEFANIPAPHVRRSPLESRFLSDRSSTLTTTNTNPDLAAFYAKQQRLRELDHELELIEEVPSNMKIEITMHEESDDQSDPSSLSEFNDPSANMDQSLPNPTPSMTERSDDRAAGGPPVSYNSKLQDAIDNYDQSSSVVKRYSRSETNEHANVAKSPLEREEPIAKLRRLFASSLSQSVENDVPTRRKSIGSPDRVSKRPKMAPIQSFQARRHSIDSPRAHNFRPIPDSSPPKSKTTLTSRLPRADFTPHARNPTPIYPVTHIQAQQQNPYLKKDWSPPSIPRRRSDEQTDQGITSSFKTSSYMPSTPQDADELSSLPDSEEVQSKPRRRRRESIELKVDKRNPGEQQQEHDVAYHPEPSHYRQFWKQNNRPAGLKTIKEKTTQVPKTAESVQGKPMDSWWSRFEKLKE